METLVITSGDISTIMSRVGFNALMGEVIQAITDFCLYAQEGSETRARDGFYYSEPQQGLLEWMPVFKKGESSTIKIIGYHPENPLRFGIPTIIGSTGVYDARTGVLRALADATLPTAIRTGAASAVASLVLAKPDSTVVGIIGCGAQAITQCHALMCRFPVRQILVYDTNSEHQSSFSKRISRMCPPGIRIKVVPIEEILVNADILCTCTSINVGDGPLFGDTFDLKPELHINAVGSDFPGKIELPKALLQRSVVIPDHLEQCMKEGECQQLLPGLNGPVLGELVRDRGKYEHLQDQLTVFDSTGWAAEDQVMMEIILKYAEQLNLGSVISLHSLPEDPLDPYHGLQEWSSNIGSHTIAE